LLPAGLLKLIGLEFPSIDNLCAVLRRGVNIGFERSKVSKTKHPLNKRIVPFPSNKTS
jgi:hypothetical protein